MGVLAGHCAASSTSGGPASSASRFRVSGFGFGLAGRLPVAHVNSRTVCLSAMSSSLSGFDGTTCRLSATFFVCMQDSNTGDTP